MGRLLKLQVHQIVFSFPVFFVAWEALYHSTTATNPFCHLADLLRWFCWYCMKSCVNKHRKLLYWLSSGVHLFLAVTMHLWRAFTWQPFEHPSVLPSHPGLVGACHRYPQEECIVYSVLSHHLTCSSLKPLHFPSWFRGLSPGAHAGPSLCCGTAQCGWWHTHFPQFSPALWLHWSSQLAAVASCLLMPAGL